MKKREPRVSTAIPARLRVGDQWSDATIMNVSRHGLMLQLPQPPERGEYIELRRLSLVIVGRIVWSRGRRCGIRAQDAIEISDLTNSNRPAKEWKAGDACRRADERRHIATAEVDSQIAGRRLQFAAVIGFLLLASFFVFDMVNDIFATAMARVTGAL